jgi:hypothetical protein
MYTPFNTHTHMGRRGSKRGSRSSKTVSTYPSADLTTAGARRAVWDGRAQKTRGGLTRDDLTVSKSTGKIVSKRASRASKLSFQRNGLRPDKNIAYKGTQYRGTKNTDEDVNGPEDLDWEALLHAA